MVEHAIEIQNLKKTFESKGGPIEALKGIDLKVEPGDFFALLGPNGAGKSTAIGVICSLINKSEGLVKIFGVDIDQDFPKAKRYLGVVPQEYNFNQFESPFDILRYQAGFFGIPLKEATARAEKYLKLMGLWDKRLGPSRMLSGGMKRRLMIARALMHEPKLLILDEPTAGVDIELRRSMWKIMQELNESGVTIILTTHYLEEAESLCRNIAIIDKGVIVKNTSMKNLLQQLQSESYILDLNEPTELNSAQIQQGVSGDVKATKLDSLTVEVEVQKGTSLNHIFEELGGVGLQVKSLRNKANRLEELFVKITSSESDSK
jgi:ABC-2 type transport system ATP-binding protein